MKATKLSKMKQNEEQERKKMLAKLGKHSAEHTLQNGVKIYGVFSSDHPMMTLCSKFQIWAEEFCKVDAAESICGFFDIAEIKKYHKSLQDDYAQLQKTCFEKIKASGATMPEVWYDNTNIHNVSGPKVKKAGDKFMFRDMKLTAKYFFGESGIEYLTAAEAVAANPENDYICVQNVENNGTTPLSRSILIPE